MSFELPCPECSRDMIKKPLKGGGWHFLCYGRDPVDHRVTIFWKRPAAAGAAGEDAPSERGSGEINAERDRVRASAPPSSQVSSRAAALLARAEKLK